MKTSRSSQLLASAALIGCFIFSQPAVAQQNHRPRPTIKIMPRDRADAVAARRDAPPWPNLYSLQAAFTQTYPTIGANSDGTDVWPCTGGSSSTGANPDCPTIGSPTILFPANATAVGNPAFVWQLKNTAGSGNGQGCDALINGTGHLGVPYLPCGQVETWYEDDSNDTTDELLYSMEAVQGEKTIYTTGTVDFGPNTYAGLTPPADTIIYNPLNFGFGPGDGPATGPNNGNCTPDFNYPLTAPASPGEAYLVAANKTCVEPVPGPATIIVKTWLGSPIYTEVKGAACTSQGVASPCYTVEWIKKYEICQAFQIWLE